MEGLGLVVESTFWAGKRVLVTGHTGFKGSWLCLWLNELGAEVCGLSLPVDPEQRSHYKESAIATFVCEVFTDVRDPSAVREVFAKFNPEVVFHLAAQALVGPSYETPVETFEVNVLGTVNVLEAARKCESVCSIVIVTTDKCYENAGWIWGYRENDPLGGDDPYSASKAAAELVVHSYRKSFFSECATRSSSAGLASVRAGNVIGGGDYTVGRLVPDVLRALANGEQCVLRNPDATRPWQHVLEPLAGYLNLAEKLASGGKTSGAWNFGPDVGGVASAKSVATQLISAWGSQLELLTSPSSFHEASVLSLDSSKSKALLGWFPKLSVSESLTWTVEWAKRVQSGQSPSAVSIDQIRRYQSK
jgi:CDP-glucose 4,6-dehydratase